MAPAAAASQRSRHRDASQRGGCRGFIGPVPLPLWMSGIQLSVHGLIPGPTGPVARSAGEIGGEHDDERSGRQLGEPWHNALDSWELLLQTPSRSQRVRDTRVVVHARRQDLIVERADVRNGPPGFLELLLGDVLGAGACGVVQNDQRERARQRGCRRCGMCGCRRCDMRGRRPRSRTGRACGPRCRRRGARRNRPCLATRLSAPRALQRDERDRRHPQPDDGQNDADGSINAPPPRRAGSQVRHGRQANGRRYGSDVDPQPSR